MTTEIEFLLSIKEEFDTAHQGEGISFNLNGMSQTIKERIALVEKNSKPIIDQSKLISDFMEYVQKNQAIWFINKEELLKGYLKSINA